MLLSDLMTCRLNKSARFTEVSLEKNDCGLIDDTFIEIKKTSIEDRKNNHSNERMAKTIRNC